TSIITTIGGNGITGSVGDGGPATSASLFAPAGVAVDAQGAVFFADSLNFRVRKIDQKTGIITNFAGTGGINNSADEGPAGTATLLLPNSVAIEPSGNLLILTAFNLRRVTPSDGQIHAVAGNSLLSGFSGDGGPASQALLDLPRYVSAAANG